MTTQNRQAMQLVQVAICCALVLVGSLYGQAPTITGFSPTSGPVGTLVTLTGTNLASPTSISIGGVQAVQVSNTGTSLVAMVMPGAASGNVSITTAGGSTTASGTFTFSDTPVPNMQQGASLVGIGAVGLARQGASVAVSADGNTAIVGGPEDNRFGDFSIPGAAWVYVRSWDGVWSQQGSKLVGSDAVGAQMQGTSVALSADGNTAIVGGSGNSMGAAWVFTRSGGVWSQQGPKLVGTGAVGGARQGISVSLSADGNTAIIGGSRDDNFVGAAWVFTRNGGVWSQEGAKLVGTGAVGNASQGFRVALSADGNTALVGGFNDNGGAGAGWVFTRSGGTWVQQGAKLVGTGAVGNAFQGVSVSLSPDGSTAILGGTGDNNSAGAAWVFTRSGGTWVQQGAKLVGMGAVGNANQGWSVSLSGDGSIALVSGPFDNSNAGAIWRYKRSAGAWSQQGSKLVGTGAVGNAYQGKSVALSADGATALGGTDSDSAGRGAVWVFVPTPPPPTIASFTPTSGGPDTVVTITGTNFIGASSVSFGGTQAQRFAVTTATTIRATVADGTTGTIQVVTPGGTATSSSTFTFVPPPAPTLSSFSPTSGPVGTLVTLTGTQLEYTRSVRIGGVQAVTVSNTGATLVVMVMPGTASGSVSITAVGGSAALTGTFSVTATLVPNRQQGAKLVGMGAVGNASQLNSVALSADGNTAIIGSNADNSNAGAVWVYTRSGEVWSQQGPKLVGTGAVGGASQGASVALSADGNTALVGASGDDSGKGAVWVFTRGGGIWSQQGHKLVGTGAVGNARQGNSVALSADGNTAIVGGYYDNYYAGAHGAFWVYTRTKGVWSQQGPKLRSVGAIGEAFLGTSVSLSADGNTALVGGHTDNGYVGAAWVYTRSGDVWSPVVKLVGAGRVGIPRQGIGVSLSADGNTAMVGGYSDNSGIGAAWVYTRSGGIWAQNGPKLVGTGGLFLPGLGFSVSLSADGNTAILGAPNDDIYTGASWMFRRSGGVWLQNGSKLVGTNAGLYTQQGTSVAMSADGNTAIVGGLSDSSVAGTGWVFVNGMTTSTEADRAADAKGALRLYPSPISRSQQLSLILPDRAAAASYTIEFVDLSGRSVLSQRGDLAAGASEVLQLSVSNLAPGTYAVRYTSGQTTTTGRVLVTD